MRRRFVPVAAVFALGAFSGFHLLFSTGIVGVTRKPNHVFAEPGCFCHSDTASARVRVWIEGPESLGAAQEHLYRILVAKDSSIGAGFNVASLLGSLGVVESSATQLLAPTPSDAPELTHIAHREADGHDTIAWSFWYRAPLTAGTVDTIFAAGNSVDNSGDPSGDEWALAPDFPVRIVSPSSAGTSPVAASYNLLQNYPNPFNPLTTIRYTIPVGTRQVVSLHVFDVLGRQVATLVEGPVEPGMHSVRWDAGGLPGGIYLCQLTYGSAVESRKMVLLR